MTSRRAVLGVGGRSEERWPELFAQLDASQRRSVLNTLAADWHEDWVPNREDVENLTDLACGAIDRDEFSHRSDAAAERHCEL